MAEHIGCIALLKEHNKGIKTISLRIRSVQTQLKALSHLTVMESIFSFKVQHINLFIAMRQQSYFFSPPVVESHFCGSVSKPSPAILQLWFHCPLEHLGAERQRNRKLPLCSDIALGPGRSPVQVGAGREMGRGSSVNSRAWLAPCPSNVRSALCIACGGGAAARRSWLSAW